MADFPAVIDLSTLDGSDGFRLDGIDADDRSGFSVSSAGDVNGDGFDDILIGAVGSDPNGNSFAGESYVLFGKASGFAAGIDLASLDGTNGFRLDGIDVNDHSGYSVVSAGDVNGDGFDDILIGAYRSDPGGDSVAGESYVVFGKASGFAAGFDLASLDGTNGFRLDGIDAYDYSGISVSSAGDVNGDGFDDILIGAYGGDPNGDTNAGESYVVFGKASGFAAGFDLASLDGTNGFKLDGIDAGDRSGYSVSSAGDVNGDGFDDILIGANGGDPNGYLSAGESYVVFGKASGFAASIDLSSLDGANGFRLDGIDASDFSGLSVSSAGDVNGDGFDDIIIGAQGADPGGDSFGGESFVVFGKASGFTAGFDLASLDGINGFRLDGIEVSDLSGASVSSAGDVNGDGFDDILIGAFRSDPNGNDSAGECYVVFGKASGFAAGINLSSLDGTNGFRLDGIDADDESGDSVSSAGDVNGDGFDDIIIGAKNADPGGDSGAGESYVVFGVAPTTAVTRVGAAGDQIIRGGAFDDNLSGLGGDDTLVGAGGDDVLLGGSGNDILNGGAGIDMATGGGGNDTFLQTDDGVLNTLNGGADADKLDLSGSTVGWTIDLVAGTGGAGATTLALSNIENVTGGDHDDTLTGDGLGNVLEGGDGDDAIDGGAGVDTASYQTASAGVDVYLMFTGIETGAGIDTLTSIENLRGSDFGDRLIGDAGDNELVGRGGADIIKGKGGNDTFRGGGGADKLTGGAGDDTMFGGAGDDILYALAGLDTLNGGADDDFLYGGQDADTLNGDGGIDNIRGNLGEDTLNGGTGDDVLRGGGSNDTLDGGDDDDILFGENHSDTLFGGAGDDSLTGGLGGGVLDGFTDTFVYTDTAGGAGGFDRIKDFENGIDVMDLTSFGFTDFTADVLPLATDTGTGLRIDFGGGDVLFVEGFLLADFDAGDVLI